MKLPAIARLRSGLGVVLILVGLAACSHGSALRAQPLTGQWRLVELLGAPGSEPTLSFANPGRVSGSAGCNSYSASIEATSAGVLRLGPVMATKMGCASTGRMQSEIAFLDALNRVAGYRHQGERLLLLDADGAVLAAFEPAVAED